MNPAAELYNVGENHIILLLSYYETSTSVSAVSQLQHRLQELAIPGLRSIRAGMDCLLLELEDGADRNRLETLLKAIDLGQLNETPGEVVKIPICYEPEFAIDLKNISNVVSLSPEEIIKIHSSQTYSVWMMGFMPGYPYMGALPEVLQIPRKSNPDPKIPAGSVAIAEEYVGVYPFDSPGGWHIVGRTPLRLFDYHRTSPSLFHFGMKVQFYSITKDKFEKIKRHEETGN
jgi:inhibitor of KinA